jgi:hypothetical protein
VKVDDLRWFEVRARLAGFAGLAGVFDGRYADDGLEILDKVRLIKVAEREGDLRVITQRISGKFFGGFLNTGVLYDPFRRHTDVLAQEAL